MRSFASSPAIAADTAADELPCASSPMMCSAITWPRRPSTAASSSAHRSSTVRPSSRAATSPRKVCGKLACRAHRGKGSVVVADLRLGQQRHELFEEEGIATAAIEQRACGGRRATGPSAIASSNDAVASRDSGSRFNTSWLWRPTAGFHRSNRSVRAVPMSTTGSDAQPFEQLVDEIENDVVRPVEVGEHDDDRMLASEAVDERQQRAPHFFAGACRIDARERAVVAHEMQQAVGHALDLGRSCPSADPPSRAPPPAAAPPRADRRR